VARAQSKGQCRLCGAEFSKAGMPRHVEKCLEQAGDTTGKRERLLHLFVEGGQAPEYWMDLLVPAQAKLGHLDDFLRGIWLECCGHMSAFTVGGKWRRGLLCGPREELDFQDKVGEVLRSEMCFAHEYDFGTTTELALRVVSEREGPQPGQKVQVLARNNPPVIPCGGCGKPATQVCAQCSYDVAGWLCELCAHEHECGEEMMLPVVNSPRTGQCGYTGPERSEPGWD
jgi:hypothetical protein